MTVGGAISSATDRLEAAGCDTPRLDAELLLAEAIGVGRERLVLDRDAPLPVDRVFEELVARREAREPVAYILGRKEFRRITVSVDRRVLIPRPDTELLVEVGSELPAGCACGRRRDRQRRGRAGLEGRAPGPGCAGSRHRRPTLSMSRGPTPRVSASTSSSIRCDLIDDRAYDAVLANLPYVCEGDLLAPEISGYEPAGALFAGVDGLDVIRRLVEVAAGRIRVLALELDPGQTGTVESLLRSHGFAAVERLRDLAGRERVVVGWA